jgi:hypothetical protein
MEDDDPNRISGGKWFVAICLVKMISCTIHFIVNG